MTKLDEMCQDIHGAVSEAYGRTLRPWRDVPEHIKDMIRRGVTLHCENHIRPLLEAAWMRCITKVESKADDLDRIEAEDYATRIINEILTQQKGTDNG